MSFARFDASRIHLHNERISEDDARRQEHAAAEILSRLDRQPGIVLADEVGMGKTFVALATATSILLERPTGGPVVVMSPPSLKEKWPRDWEIFRSKCLSAEVGDQLRARSADNGVAFLRLLDDPTSTRSHIIFLSHGALDRAMKDGFVKLAVVKRAFRGRPSLAQQRASFQRFAGGLLRLEYIEKLAPGLLGRLLDTPYGDWRRVIQRFTPALAEKVDDDPIPEHLVDALDAMSASDLEKVVAGLHQLPLRASDNIKDRLARAREGIAGAMEEVWKTALKRAAFTSPLLVLDEAHHVKNPGTRLASLFASEEAAAESDYFESAGALGAKFERMLFLTATPFQLGHGELLRVLERFEGIAWNSPRPPQLTRGQFKAELDQLGKVLDDAQAAALRLDRAWGTLTADEVLAPLADETPASLDADLETGAWWERGITEGEGKLARIAAQVKSTGEAMRAAERCLSPWVLRHLKPAELADSPGVDRRRTLTGAAIRENGSTHTGIEIDGDALLPFLLAGRAQTLLAARTNERALFAEGLASSFEAYLETRSNRFEVDDDDTERTEAARSPRELDWYLSQLDVSLPRGDRTARSRHPKVRATAERAVALWKQGEKVLVFCHYRATGRALRQHISSLLSDEITSMAQEKLPGRSAQEAQRTVDDLGQRFFDDDRLRGVVTDWVRSILSAYPALDQSAGDVVVDVVRRFIRTPSFLVRYFPLDSNDPAAAFQAAVEGSDDEQRSLRRRIDHFCRFLAERCTPKERADFLDALGSIQTGSHLGKEVERVFDPRELDASGAPGASLLPNVRLANGEVSSETRRRLLLTFNTPLFPEILIASSVMAEGVDLHLNCRFVIHHDLCWNPSTLEQRSGRVDRIGSRAEQVKEPIHLYMPYIAATQDEKMFRVVRDRERWFQVIMGEKYQVDEATTDRQAARVPLPPQVQRELAMRLHP
jgi:ERCC4-related helicase